MPPDRIELPETLKLLFFEPFYNHFQTTHSFTVRSIQNFEHHIYDVRFSLYIFEILIVQGPEPRIYWNIFVSNSQINQKSICRLDMLRKLTGIDFGMKNSDPIDLKISILDLECSFEIKIKCLEIKSNNYIFQKDGLYQYF